jgi:hypothetical protein
LLAATGFDRYQGPGTTSLLGARSASGSGHELDGAGRKLGPLEETVILEAKAVTALAKAEVISFAAKVFDFYAAGVPGASRSSWHQVLVSAAPVSEGLRMLCAERTVILVDPQRMPLPVLLWMAAKPNADDRLPGPLLAECLRLGQRAVAAVQQRWQFLDDGRLAYDPTWWLGTALADLCYVHDELSGEVLDLYDRDRPGALERRAAALTAELYRHA